MIHINRNCRHHDEWRWPTGEYSASAIMSTAARTTTGGRSTFHSALGLLGVLGVLWAMQEALHTHTPPAHQT